MEPWSCLRLFSWCGFIGSVNNFDMTKRNWNNVSSEEAAILITDMNKAVGKDNIYGCQYDVKHFPLHELQGNHYKNKYGTTLNSWLLMNLGQMYRLLKVHSD